MLVPAWRRRWLFSPYPFAAALIAVAVFSPVLIWNAQHDWASFRFQFVRAVATHELSLRTVGDFIGLQFGLVGFVLLPVVLTGSIVLAASLALASRATSLLSFQIMFGLMVGGSISAIFAPMMACVTGWGIGGAMRSPSCCRPP